MDDTTEKVTMAFEPASVSVPVSDILLLRQVSSDVRKSRKYRQIMVSIQKTGIAQPPIVSRHPRMKGRYVLLDGHLRIDVLKEQGADRVTCLVSLDDEAFTYNRHVNRLATIQEHKMILKLVERGVPEKLIAEALDVNITSIRTKRNLLNGICPEAADILKDKQCPINTIRAIKKMKPERQVEAAELMVAMNNYSVSYAGTLVASTPPELLNDGESSGKSLGASPEQIARMEREMANLQQGIRRIESTYGSNHLTLVLAVGYLRSMLANKAIDRHLDKYHPELRGEFMKICEATALVSEAG